MTQEIRHHELEDALRRLSAAIGPVAAAAETDQPAPAKVRARTPVLVAVIATFAAAIAAGALVALAPGSDSEPPVTVAIGSRQDDETARLRSALAEAMEEQRRLSAELERTRAPVRWYNDRDLLTYRSPWPPR